MWNGLEKRIERDRYFQRRRNGYAQSGIAGEGSGFSACENCFSVFGINGEIRERLHFMKFYDMLSGLIEKEGES